MKVPISLFTSVKPSRLTKGFTKKDGQLVSEPGGPIIDGKVQRVEVEFPQGFAGLLTQLVINQACGYGVTDVDEAHITTRENAGPGDLARIRENFKYTAAAAVMMIDYDVAPGAVPWTRQKLVEFLESVCPELAACAMVVTDSASTHIVDTDTGEELKGEGGKRVYFVAENGQDIPRAGQVLFDRLVLAGHGYIKISKSGSMLVRAAIDESVWQPERLDFVAGAACGPGLMQTRPAPSSRDGGLLNTVTALPPLSPEEEQRRDAIIANLKADAQDEADAVRAAWVEDRVLEHEQRAGRTLTAEEKQAMRDLMGDAASTYALPDEFVLHPAGATVTVGEMLADLARWDGTTFADPLEPDYHGGEPLAKLICLPGKPPYITSFAHGGIVYSFASMGTSPTTPPGAAAAPPPAPTFDSLKQRVEAISPTAKPDEMDAALAPILVDLVNVGGKVSEDIQTLISTHLGMKKKTVTEALKKQASKAKAAKKSASPPAPPAASSGGGLTMDVRCDEGLKVFTSDLLPHMKSLSSHHGFFINNIMTKTVTRVTDSKLVHYAFGSEELANLVYSLLCEAGVRFVMFSPAANKFIPVTPSQRELKAVLSTPERFWPTIHHWCDGPVLLPDGEILQPGFTELDGVGYFGHFETPFVEMPIDEALAVIRGTLSEVSFRSEADFANALALRFSCALRFYLGPVISPLFLFIATERQSGKTTLAILITCICKSSIQVCSPSMEETELEKRIATEVLNGVACIVLDNMDDVPIGTYIEGFITKPDFDCRLLGKNQSIHADLRPLLAVTFNLGSQNELSDANVSRAILIELETRGSATTRRLRNRYVLDDIAADKGEVRTRELHATLSCLLPYVRAGAPTKDNITCRFPRWADVMSGLLDFLGVPGFMSNQNRLENLQDPSTVAWGPVLHALYLEFEDKTFLANQVLDRHRRLTTHAGPSLEVCLPVTGNPDADKRTIGIALSKATTWRTHLGAEYRCATISGAATKTSNRYQIERKECSPTRECPAPYPDDLQKVNFQALQGKSEMTDDCLDSGETPPPPVGEEKNGDDEGVGCDGEVSPLSSTMEGPETSPDPRSYPDQDQTERLAILNVLSDGQPRSLGKLDDETGLGLSVLKQHLETLEAMGLVLNDEDGRWERTRKSIGEVV